jgi:RimJ/RimL family protein N-acetyltransferase
MIGERLYLSPVNTEDAETYIKSMNDKALDGFSPYYSVISSKNDLKWLFEPNSDIQRYAIVLLDEDIMIGCISLQNINHRNRNAFIGIFIGEEEHRSKGYGTEAIRLILDYGFKTMNLHNIMLSVFADNTAAITCYKKVGFRESRRRREYVFKDGKYIDKIFIDILENEFVK